MNLFDKDIDISKYIVVDYYIKSKTNLSDAAWNIAIGQSIGNPSLRSNHETPELYQDHSCFILEHEKILSEMNSGIIKIAFPLSNINLKEDGISQLLCQIMGGQLDIDIFEKCHIKNIEFPGEALTYFLGPKYGIKGIRKYTEVYNKPILGGIVKPKVVSNLKMLLEIVKEMVEGGVNFIKEDEIMSSPLCCPIEERVPAVMDYLWDKKIIYAVCINSDPPYLLDRVEEVLNWGGNAIHVNFWSGLGAYKAIRELNYPMFLFFQKSGDKILTNSNHAFHIDWNVLCDLAGFSGVDFIHAGMWGGYSSYEENELKKTIKTLHNHHVMPSLSCGMHPGLIDSINKKFGIDYMANVGGAIHNHPMGTKAGSMAMRQAIDKNYKIEYYKAIEKWGKEQ